MATKYVKSIKFTSSGEVYQIRDAEAKQRLDSLVIPDITGLASEAYVNQAVAPKANASSVYTKAEVDLALNSKADVSAVDNKQDTLVSGSNIKTINNQSILGSGNITIQGGSGTSDYTQLENLPSINNETLTGNKTSANLGLQDTLVSGTNIKTINNQSILGSGNIEVGGGSGAVSSVNGKTGEVVLNASDVGAASSSELSNKQDTLVSGTNIKTINGNSILGSGNLEIQGGSGATLDYKNSSAVFDVDSTKKVSATALPKVECTAEQARQAFYTEMTAEAAATGMTDTVYASASGLSASNVTTSNDSVKLGAKAIAYPEAAEIWSCEAKTVVTSGSVKTLNLESTTVDHDGWADVMKTDYVVLGGKIGSYNSSNDYVITLKAKDTQDVFTICVASSTTETSTNNCHVYAKKLADIAKLLRVVGEFGITDSDNIQNSECKAAVKAIEATLLSNITNATVILTPQYSTAFDGQNIIDGTEQSFLYSYNGSTTFATADVTKVMTMLLTLKWVADLNSTFEVTAADVESGSGPALTGGEVLTYKDALYVMMLDSSDTVANTLARVVGEKIYSIKNRL